MFKLSKESCLNIFKIQQTSIRVKNKDYISNTKYKKSLLSLIKSLNHIKYFTALSQFTKNFQRNRRQLCRKCYNKWLHAGELI